MEVSTFVQTAQSVGILVLAGALVWAVYELKRAIDQGVETISRLFERQADIEALLERNLRAMRELEERLSRR
jgi:hypothetical protein